MVVLTSVTPLNIMRNSYSKCTHSLILALDEGERSILRHGSFILVTYSIQTGWKGENLLVLEVELNLGSSSPLYSHYTDPVLCSRLCASCQLEAALSESPYSPSNAVFFLLTKSLLVT